MAEGWLRHLADDRFTVYSAGTHPSHVHPMSIRVMDEVGIDIRQQTSDPIDDYLSKQIDTVITVCDSAKEACPVFPGNVKHLHWSVDDPFRGWEERDSDLLRYRETRDELKERILDFLSETETS